MSARTKTLCWFAGILLCILPVQLGAESYILHTYYPSPVGVYNELLTTGKTILARDGGNVGIGTTDPGTNKLKVVGGPIKATGGLIVQLVGSQGVEDSMTKTMGQIWLRTDITP